MRKWSQHSEEEHGGVNIVRKGDGVKIGSQHSEEREST